MVYVYTEKYTPRFKYIVQHIFERILCTTVEIIKDKEKAEALDAPLICYSRECTLKNAFNICPHGLVFQDGIRAQEVTVSDWNGTKIFFKTGDATYDLPFDIFSASFYLISRYEEYSGENDEMGRFRKEGSIAFKNGFLDRPVVDEWAYMLEDLMAAKIGYVPSKKNEFRVHSSIIIDSLYKYRYNLILKNLYQLNKKLFTGNWDSFKHQFKVVMFVEKDPYDCMDKIIRFHNNINLNPSFFVTSKMDFGAPLKSILSLRSLRKTLRRNYPTGFHSSIKAGSDVKKLRKELASLEKRVVKQRVETNLFPSACFSLPKGYESLLKVGITIDYSMGYIDAIGFRASTCTPFRFYDIKHESKTKLMVHPLAFSDMALKNAGISHTMFDAALLPVIERVKLVNGQLCCAISNKMFSNSGKWYGWESALQSIYGFASKLETGSLEKVKKMK